MTDFAARLVARTLGTAPLIEPRAPVRFGPRAEEPAAGLQPAAPDRVMAGPSPVPDARASLGPETRAEKDRPNPPPPAPPRAAGPGPRREGARRTATAGAEGESVSILPRDRPPGHEEAPARDATPRPPERAAPSAALRGDPAEAPPHPRKTAASATPATAQDPAAGTSGVSRSGVEASDLPLRVAGSDESDAVRAASRPAAIIAPAGDEPVADPDRGGVSAPAPASAHRPEIGRRPEEGRRTEKGAAGSSPATRQAEAEAEPLPPIIVEIGAIEFRAPAPAAVAAPAAPPRGPALSLDAYLARRRGAS